MRKLMVVLAVLALVSGSGSIVLKERGHENAIQGICRAPDPWIHSVLNDVPQVPAFIEQQGKTLESLAPGVASFIDSLPVGKGSLLEKWILKPSPRYL